MLRYGIVRLAYHLVKQMVCHYYSGVRFGELRYVMSRYVSGAVSSGSMRCVKLS